MTLELQVKEVSSILKSKNLTISVVESCSGGLLASLFTANSGASEFFDSGIVSYSNNAKMDLLNVPAEILDKYGAVSYETAEILAANLRKLRNTDVTIAITGIAGPKSDNTKKPIGLVYIAVNYRGKALVRKCMFTGSRQKIQQQSCLCAMEILRSLFT